ncbi:MAG: hypothetical protein IJ192_00045 [Clostridia bacterium]|nr:hypothetical protein [Clostridia bacterium]
MMESYRMYKSKLTGEYKDAFEKIDIYIGATSIDSASKEELMSSLTDTFLSAQEEGKPVEKITGRNIEHFCHEVCSGYGFKEHFIAFFEFFRPMTYIFFILTFVPFFDELEKNSILRYFSIQTSVEMILGFITGMIWAYLLDLAANKIIKKVFVHKRKTTVYSATLVHVCVLMISLLLLGVVIVLMDYIAPGDDESIWYIPLWVAQLISLGLVVICNALPHKIKKQNIDSTVDVFDSYYNESFYRSLENTETKRFEKQNKRREKKDQPLLSEQEFYEKEIKKLKRELNPLYYIIIVLVAPFFCIVFGFDGITDFLIFYGVCIVIEGAVMLAIYLPTRKAMLKRLAWLESKLNSDESI